MVSPMTDAIAQIRSATSTPTAVDSAEPRVGCQNYVHPAERSIAGRNRAWATPPAKRLRPFPRLDTGLFPRLDDAEKLRG